MWLIIIMAFAAGWGWGSWNAERVRAAVEKGRLNISMPMKPEDAEATLGLLEEIVAQVRRNEK